MAISTPIDELTRKGAARGIDLRPGLARVEEELRETVAAKLPFAEHASRYLIDAGGKRFRPMLVLLAGMAGDVDPTDADLVSAGVIVELVHLSTLYHDDIIDDPVLRRGQVPAHTKWSNTVAILTGDFLLARASERSAALGVEVTRIMARTIADLCQGQIREIQGSDAAARHGLPTITADREHYLAVIGEKTASLIASSCRLGALLSDQPAMNIEAFTRYGWSLGMSFQLADDLLDIAGEVGESGKEPGTDLREGVRTLPVLLALEADGPGSELASLLDDPVEARVTEALGLLREHPALELARDVARLEAAKAQRELETLEDIDETIAEGLAYLCDYAVDRLS